MIAQIIYLPLDTARYRRIRRQYFVRYTGPRMRFRELPDELAAMSNDYACLASDRYTARQLGGACGFSASRR
jgi:hypothetical protein